MGSEIFFGSDRLRIAREPCRLRVKMSNCRPTEWSSSMGMALARCSFARYFWERVVCSRNRANVCRMLVCTAGFIFGGEPESVCSSKSAAPLHVFLPFTPLSCCVGKKVVAGGQYYKKKTERVRSWSLPRTLACNAAAIVARCISTCAVPHDLAACRTTDRE